MIRTEYSFVATMREIEMEWGREAAEKYLDHLIGMSGQYSVYAKWIWATDKARV